MKKFNYSLARERVELATAIVKLVTASMIMVKVGLMLSGVAFNYLLWAGSHAFATKMAPQV